MGDAGLERAAESCYAKAHYLAAGLAAAGYPLRYNAPFFNEFVTQCPGDPEELLLALEDRDILGGLPLPQGGVLWCGTELNTKEEMDVLIDGAKEVLRGWN